MHCDRTRDLIGAYLDGELTGAERQAVAEHLQSCATCAEDAADHKRVGRRIAMAAREVAPDALLQRIRKALATSEEQPYAMTVVHKQPRAWMTRYGGQAAALAAGCLVSAVLTWFVASNLNASAHLERDVAAAHIRSLLQDSPFQIASSDAHTVKPWFTGRIEFAPEFRDLTAEGFPLLGGRLDYVNERRVGAIVYKRRQHVVNVFMWPSSAATSTPAIAATQKGYNMLSWSREGVMYWAVSDLNLGELRQFQSLL